MLMFSSFNIMVRGSVEIIIMIMIYFTIYSIVNNLAYKIIKDYNIMSILLLISEVSMQLCLLNSDYRTYFGDDKADTLILPGDVPAILLFPILIVFLIATVSINIKMKRWKKFYITAFSLKEGTDKLPVGIVFFYEEGRVILANKVMNRLSYELTHEMIRNGEEFWKYLQHGNLAGGKLEASMPDNLIIRKDGDEIWSFERTVISSDENKAWQLIAIDITDVYEMYDQLQKRYKELQDLNEKLRNYSNTLEAVTREEEILDAKIKIHDELGHVLLATKYFIVAEESEIEKENLLHMWKNVVSLMQRKTDNEQRAYFSQILNHAADTLGAEIKWSGSFPDNETEVANLLIHAGKECLANMIRHANGNILYIYAEDLPESWSFEFKNNGDLPETEIIERGGLSGLRHNVEKLGGEMCIECAPMFKLIIIVPKNIEKLL